MPSKLPSYEWIQQQYHKVYIPATVEAPSGLKRFKSSIPLALQETPDQICGIARRVGWKQETGSDEAIYRLKLKVSVLGLGSATVPGFFVLKGGAFREFVSSNASSVE